MRPEPAAALWFHYILAAVPGDPGQPVAVAVVEQGVGVGARLRPATSHLILRHAELVPAGTRLPDVAVRLVSYLTGLDGSEQCEGGVGFALDTAALGHALTARLREAGRWPLTVEITGGGHLGATSLGDTLLPRRDLIVGLQLAAQEGLFKLTPGLALADRFAAALRSISTRPPSAGTADPFDAARREVDEGLVMAAALAVWVAGRGTPGPRGAAGRSRPRGFGDYHPHEVFLDRR
jgi:hypothetical protein